jgi:hypothetical protein
MEERSSNPFSHGDTEGLARRSRNRRSQELEEPGDKGDELWKEFRIRESRIQEIDPPVPCPGYFLCHLCLFAAKIPRSERLDLLFNKCAQRNVISRHCVRQRSRRTEIRAVGPKFRRFEVCRGVLCPHCYTEESRRFARISPRVRSVPAQRKVAHCRKSACGRFSLASELPTRNRFE